MFNTHVDIYGFFLLFLLNMKFESQLETQFLISS